MVLCITIGPSVSLTAYEFQAFNFMLIADRYLVEEELGRGGMGVVYKCKDRVLNKFVAVKVLQAIDLEAQAARFHRESVINAKLKHKNIIDVLDFGQTQKGELYLVSEYLEGRTLTSLLAERGAFELPDALPIFLEICDGLSHAHKHGIYHRDVKPANIMVLNNSSVARIKILDFGIAHDTGDGQHLTRPGASIGTPFYIAPEQAMGTPVDGRADVYSVGCLMFEVLAGEPPFRDDSVVETILMHKDKPAPSLKDVGGIEYGDSLENILSKCLKKNRDDRYASIDELKADLERLEERDLWKQVTIAGGKYLPPGQSQSFLWVGVLVMVLGLVGVVALWMLSHNYAEEKPKTKAKAPLLLTEAELAKKMKADEKYRISSGEYQAGYDDRDDGTRLYRIHGKVDDRRLRQIVKDFPKIEYLALHGDIFAGDGFGYLGSLNLLELTLGECDLSDEGLRNLAHLPVLKELNLELSSGFSTAGLEYLSDSRSLKNLKIVEGEISDRDIEPISRVSKLESLKLESCSMLKGTTLGLLSRLENLRFLDLHKSALDGANLKNVAQLRSLESLDLSKTGITDKDLAPLLPMKLKVLLLRENKITDKGLMQLSEMPSLEALDLSDCADITYGGARKFMQKRPSCRLECDPGDRRGFRSEHH